MRLFSGLTFMLVSLTASAGELNGPAYVEDCQSCTLTIGEGVQPYTISFQVKRAGDGSKIVSEIEVSHGGGKDVQRLPVTSEMLPVMPGSKFFFGGVDINFDGYLDLMLITRRGVVNAYADYWIYNPVDAGFDQIGNYPVFTIDSSKRELSTFERGGMGGAISDTKHYGFVSGKLTLLRSEETRPQGKNHLVTTFWEYHDGVKKEVSVKKSRIAN